MPFGMGPAELLIVLAIVVVLFGASRLGDLGGSIGRGIREFRREVKEGQEEPAKEDEETKSEKSEEHKV